MKKMILLVCLILCLPMMAFAQEKVEAPVWNVGDKWVFTGGRTIEVLKVDQNGYVVKFSDAICVIESQGFNTIVFEKSTLHRIYTLKGDKRKKYTMGLKKIFNFPFTPGKQWKDAYGARPLVGPTKGQISLDYYEIFKVSGWEEVGVQAEKFRAMKLEVIRGHDAVPQRWIPAYESKGLYWYSPDVKYFVKCQYDPSAVKDFPGEVVNWELTSFKVKK